MPEPILPYHTLYDLSSIKMMSEICQRRSLLLLGLPLLRHSSEPVKENRPTNVKGDERPHDSKVAPALRVTRTDGGQICVRVRYRAKLAGLRGVGVRDVPACPADIALQIFSAGLPARGIEDGIFDVGAGNINVSETGG